MRSELEVFIKDFDVVVNALDMRDLQRWNGRSLRCKENLSEHTHLVVACAIKLYDELCNELHIDFEKLIRLAMLHDSLEVLNGDILSTTKDAIQGLRKLVDDEEDLFVNNVLSIDDNELEKDLVRLADVQACLEFMIRELSYPTNNFANSAYLRAKKVYEDCLQQFKMKYKIDKDNKLQFDSSVRFSKGYKNDAGIDVILDRDVLFLPHSTTTIDLNINVTPDVGEMAVLCARTSAAVKGINVAMCPIDTHYSGNVSAIVHNISNEIITYGKGQSFCQVVTIKLSNKTNYSDKIVVKKQGNRTNGKFGSTGGI